MHVYIVYIFHLFLYPGRENTVYRSGAWMLELSGLGLHTGSATLTSGKSLHCASLHMPQEITVNELIF
jgi:hypothetical protein